MPSGSKSSDHIRQCSGSVSAITPSKSKINVSIWLLGIISGHLECLERFHDSRTLSRIAEGQSFLRKRPLDGCGLGVPQWRSRLGYRSFFRVEGIHARAATDRSQIGRELATASQNGNEALERNAQSREHPGTFRHRQVLPSHSTDSNVRQSTFFPMFFLPSSEMPRAHRPRCLKAIPATEHHLMTSPRHAA